MHFGARETSKFDLLFGNKTMDRHTRRYLTYLRYKWVVFVALFCLFVSCSSQDPALPIDHGNCEFNVTGSVISNGDDQHECEYTADLVNIS